MIPPFLILGILLGAAILAFIAFQLGGIAAQARIMNEQESEVQ